MFEYCPTGVVTSELLDFELVDDDVEVSGGEVENGHALLRFECAGG